MIKERLKVEQFTIWYKPNLCFLGFSGNGKLWNSLEIYYKSDLFGI